MLILSNSTTINNLSRYSNNLRVRWSKRRSKSQRKKKGKKVKQVASEETEQPNQEDGDFDKLLKAAKEMGEKLFEDQARGPVKHVGGKLCHMKTIPNTCKAPYKNCHAYICGRDYGCGKGVC